MLESKKLFVEFAFQAPYLLQGELPACNGRPDSVIKSAGYATATPTVMHIPSLQDDSKRRRREKYITVCKRSAAYGEKKAPYPPQGEQSTKKTLPTNERRYTPLRGAWGASTQKAPYPPQGEQSTKKTLPTNERRYPPLRPTLPEKITQGRLWLFMCRKIVNFEKYLYNIHYINFKQKNNAFFAFFLKSSGNVSPQGGVRRCIVCNAVLRSLFPLRGIGGFCSPLLS